MLLVSYIQQYFNTFITVLTNQVWKLLIALFKVLNTGAFTVHPKFWTIQIALGYWCLDPACMLVYMYIMVNLSRAIRLSAFRISIAFSYGWMDLYRYGRGCTLKARIHLPWAGKHFLMHCPTELISFMVQRQSKYFFLMIADSLMHGHWTH